MGCSGYVKTTESRSAAGVKRHSVGPPEKTAAVDHAREIGQSCAVMGGRPMVVTIRTARRRHRKLAPRARLPDAFRKGDRPGRCNGVHGQNLRATGGVSETDSLALCLARHQRGRLLPQRDDGADTETYRALVPGLSTLAGSMLIGISSPYRQAGLLHDKYRDHYGKDGDVLFVKAPTTASAEWLGQFRDDIAGFVDVALIEGCVDRGVTVRAPREGMTYWSHVDVSGGIRDSATVAISHAEGEVAVLDCVVEVRAPHNPVDAVWQLAQTSPWPLENPPMSLSITSALWSLCSPT
jgi:hypothetical protein